MNVRKTHGRPFTVIVACAALLTAHAAYGSATVDDFSDYSELELEELLDPKIYGASKFNQKSSDAPAAVTVINADEIKAYGYRTFSDILRSARSMYTSYDRSYTYLGMRGLNRPADYNARILVLIDGHRLNDNVWDSVLAGNDFILDVDTIERVEIIRGPSSSLYGANAFFGVINVVIKSGADVRGIEGAAQAQTPAGGRARASFGAKLDNGLDLHVSASGFGNRGHRELYYREFDAAGTNFGIAPDADRETAANALFRASYGEFKITSAYNIRRKNVPTGNYGTVFGDQRYKTSDARLFVRAGYGGDRSWGGYQADVYFDDYRYEGTYPFDYPPVTLNIDRSIGNLAGSEGRLTYSKIPRNRVTVGAETRYNFRQYYTNFDKQPFARYYNIKRNTWVLAGFAQDEFTVAEDLLLLNAGVRYDYYDYDPGTPSPRAGAIFSPGDTTVFKALYGRAFRAPNVYELVNEPDPEIIDSFELVAEQELPWQLRATATWFRNVADKLIDIVPNDPDGVPGNGDELFPDLVGTPFGQTAFVNSNTVTTVGGEGEIMGAWRDGYRLRASYSYQRSRIHPGNSVITNSPEHMAKLNGVMPIPFVKAALSPMGAYLGAEGQYISERYPADVTKRPVGGYFIANTNILFADIVDGLDASFAVQNVTGRHYADPGRTSHIQREIEQDGRSFMLKVSYRVNTTP